MTIIEFIIEKTDSINVIGITESISEEYLNYIFEEYYKLCVNDISNETWNKIRGSKSDAEARRILKENSYVKL